MNKSIIQLIIVHFKSFFREPAILFWAIAFPVLMAWVLGVAFTEKRESKKRIYILADSTGNTPFRYDTLLGTDTGNPTRVTFISSTRPEAMKALQRGEISLFLEEKKDSVIYYFDPSNADAQLTHLIIERGLYNKPSKNTTIVSPLTTKGTRYIDFLIPGLIALGILNSCLWGIGWNLIELRMKKLLRRMIATPMKKSHFLISLIATRVILSGVESLILFFFAFLYFGTTVEGSVPALILVYLSGIFAFSGIAILTASRTQNSQVGNGLINAVSLPMMILSGIFFSYQNFPEWVIPIIKALPLTLLADSIRGVFIEGMGLEEMALPILILLLTGATTFSAGLKFFKWY